jgi:hypothetical protein
VRVSSGESKSRASTPAIALSPFAVAWLTEAILRHQLTTLL